MVPNVFEPLKFDCLQFRYSSCVQLENPIFFVYRHKSNHQNSYAVVRSTNLVRVFTTSDGIIRGLPISLRWLEYRFLLERLVTYDRSIWISLSVRTILVDDGELIKFIFFFKFYLFIYLFVYFFYFFIYLFIH